MNRFALRTLPLRYVLAWVVLLGLLVPSWMAYQIETADAQQRLSEKLANDRDRYADMLAVTLSLPLWQFEPLFAAPLIDKIMEDPQVTSVIVKRLPQGDVFISRNKANTPTDSTAMRAISMQGIQLGEVAIAVNASAVLMASQDAQQRFLWRTAGISVGSMLLIFLVLHWRLTGPIGQLVRQSEALASGHLQDALTWHRDDELGRVGHSLEKTRVALSALVGELQNVNADLRTENTHRKVAETHLARHAEELELRVAERTGELSSANAALSVTLENLRKTQNDLVESKKLASLGRMVSGLAHELNTPIGTALTIGTSIGEQVRTMQRTVEEGQLKRSSFTEFLGNAAEASEILERLLHRAAGLVESFKKVTERDSAPVLESFELAELLASACDEFESTPAAHPIALVAHIPPHIYMTSYPELLSQAVGNVLKNTQIHAFTTHAHAQVTLDAAVTDGVVTITISDNGVGIPESIQERVFEPLFTAHFGRGGVGLGLSVTQNIVTRNLGGTVHVHTNADGGASFVIAIPLAINDEAGT